MCGWMDGWMDGWMGDSSISSISHFLVDPVCLQSGGEVRRGVLRNLISPLQRPML